MPYFTAVLARSGRTWSSRNIALEPTLPLNEVATELRLAIDSEEPTLLLVEREDAWWAVVRVDGEEDPRVFVSDVVGVAASTYAEQLDTGGIEDADHDPAPGTCGGDLDVLADLGTSPDDLHQMCDDELLPMDALATVAERAGFADVLDALR